MKITKLSILLALGTVMSVGQSVGSCRTVFGALYSFMTILAACMTFATEHRSGAKLHWHITISSLLTNGNRHSNSLLQTTLVILASSGKNRTNLLGHLHGQLQICRLLGTYTSLNIPLQAINKTEERFCII